MIYRYVLKTVRQHAHDWRSRAVLMRSQGLQVVESDLPQIGPDRLIDAFPEHAFAIRRRLVSDPHFRSICEDYLDAVQALRHWEASCEPQSAIRQSEYCQLIDNLLVEIATALGEPPSAANT